MDCNFQTLLNLPKCATRDIAPCIIEVLKEKEGKFECLSTNTDRFHRQISKEGFNELTLQESVNEK